MQQILMKNAPAYNIGKDGNLSVRNGNTDYLYRIQEQVIEKKVVNT